MGELASLLHCDNSNITWIVDKLSERGLVERRASPGDRRVKLVALTDEGAELRDELARRRAEPPPEMACAVGDELKSLGSILAKLSVSAEIGPDIAAGSGVPVSEDVPILAEVKPRSRDFQRQPAHNRWR